MRAVGNHRPFFLPAVSRLHLPVVARTATLRPVYQESFMRILAALALCLGLFTAAPVMAQAQADPGFERRTELADRYMRLTLGEDMRPLIESLIEEELAAQPHLSPEERAWYRQNMPVFFEAFMNALIADMAPRYAASMTEEELAAAIEFYSSPVGRSIARKELMLQVDFETEMYAAAEVMAVDIQTKYCAAFDCDEFLIVVPSTK